MSTNWIRKLVSSTRKGMPTVPQINPQEKDPVSNETAEEAFNKKQRGETPFVNPFHAKQMEEMRRR